jgi:hypothetical protein
LVKLVGLAQVAALNKGTVRRLAPPIKVDLTNNSADARAFFPSRKSILGKVKLKAEIKNAPPNSTYKWIVGDPDAVQIKGERGRLRADPTKPREFVAAKISGLRPGKTTIFISVIGSSNTAIGEDQICLCVPQFVEINEDTESFNSVLDEFNLRTEKNKIITVARQTAEKLLETSNVRLVWRIGSYPQTLPPHLPLENVTKLTIRGEPPKTEQELLSIYSWVAWKAANEWIGTSGFTSSPDGIGHNVFNETITIWPGAFDNELPAEQKDDTEVDIETQELMAEMKSLDTQHITDQTVIGMAITIYGRLIGFNIAHEVLHSLLGYEVNPTDPDDRTHNSTSHSDIMDKGWKLTFTQRTGFHRLNPQVTLNDPADYADNFVDEGLDAIKTLGPANQRTISEHFPIRPPRMEV